jgi:para-nitrobenzyl esterase
VCPNSFSEDCLFLNVWTPRLAAITEPLPVLIFIHGGAFKDGYAGGIDYGIVYDASSWVNATQAVVVSINYRLGAMGFLYQGGSTTLQGNYGLMDQEMAFRWVQQNIAPFGGDPQRITVVGQSAGAMSIAAHLSRPTAGGLFQGAIMHSEPFALPFRTPATGQDLSNSFAQFGGCSDGSAGVNWTQVEACLRSLNATQLIAAEDAAMKSIAANWERIIDVFVPWTPTGMSPCAALMPLACFVIGIMPLQLELRSFP